MALPRLLEVEELFADPTFSKVSISPDGTKLAYLAPAYGKTNVYIRGLDQTHDEATLVTHDRQRGIKTYYWSDDPRWLLYRQDDNGNEDWHLWRVDLDSPDAEAVDLTPLPPGQRMFGGGPLKSKPGHVGVGMNPRILFFDSFTINVSTGETTLVYEADSMLNSYLGPDVERRFYVEQAEDGTRNFYAVDDVATGAKRLLFSEDGPSHPVGHFPMYPTPDGQALLLGAYNGQDDLKLYRLDHATGEMSLVLHKPGQSLCSSGIFAEDFGYPPSLFFNPAAELVGIRVVGDRPEVVPLHPHFAEVYDELMKLADGGELGWVSSDDSEQLWTVTFIHDRRPGLSYLYDHRTRESRLLYDPATQLDPAELAAMTSVRFAARDGLPLHAFLTLPVGVEHTALPMVLIPHGGPWAHDLWGFDRAVQFLANRGYAVLQVNFRGSTGYGQRHITSAIRQLAGTMHDDLIDACDWAVAQGIADPQRIGIFGGSYGGYSTLVGVTFTPDYFAAAVDWVGVTNLVDFQGNLPDFVKPVLQNSWIAYAGDPAIPEDHADMLARSPSSHLDKIVTPLLVVQGAMDARVARSESDALVAGLRERGVDVEYFLAEDEGHDFTNPENLATMYRLIEKHFGKHLGGRVSPHS